MTSGKEYVTIAGSRVCLADLPADIAATIRVELARDRRRDDPPILPGTLALADEPAPPSPMPEPAGLRPLEELAAERRAALARYNLAPGSEQADKRPPRPAEPPAPLWRTWSDEVVARARRNIGDRLDVDVDEECERAARQLAEEGRGTPDRPGTSTGQGRTAPESPAPAISRPGPSLTLPNSAIVWPPVARLAPTEAECLELGQPAVGSRPVHAIRVHLRRDRPKPGELRYADPAGRWWHSCQCCGCVAVLRLHVGHAWGCPHWETF